MAKETMQSGLQMRISPEGSQVFTLRFRLGDTNPEEILEKMKAKLTPEQMQTVTIADGFLTFEIVREKTEAEKISAAKKPDAGSCEGRPDSSSASKRRLLIGEFKEIIAESVVEPMLEFIEEDEEPAYSRKDVKTCEALLLGYVRALKALKKPSDDEIMAQVKAVVLALNELNETTGGEMIETGEREAICEVIQEAAKLCGLRNIPEDVTEAWREW